jgi:hypothetical protein
LGRASPFFKSMALLEDRMNPEMQQFQEEHGKPLTFGMAVEVKESTPYACDWRGTFLVTGIYWDPRNQEMNITIAGDWNDGGHDGWKPCDLRPVAI